MFAYPGGKAIKCIKRDDGKACVDIVVLKDGRFQFMQHAEATEDDMTYWTPTGESGFYESAEAAEREARAEVPWLTESDNRVGS